MKKYLLIGTLFLITFLSFGSYFFLHSNNGVRESIISFPLDPDIKFQSSNNKLSVLDEKDEDEYVLKWQVESGLGEKVYLRQDIGLLFSDGKLIDKMSKWQEDTNVLNQFKKIPCEDSSHFQTISFHHGEIHYEDDIIKSSQEMSVDHLYVINSPKQPLESFRMAASPSEEEWKEVLDHTTKQQLKYSWNKLLQHYNIPIDNYNMIPLTSLHKYNEEPFPGLTLEETQELLGGIWEGLYKNYFLGLKRKDGTTVDPIGSIIPLILQNKKHFIILIESKDGEAFQLVL